MQKWQRIVDRLIADSIGDGDVSHLPGAGKRLPLNDDPNTPDDLRAAFKIMEDHNVAPEWIETSRRLEAKEAALRSQLETRAQKHNRDLRRVRQEASAAHAQAVDSKWRRYQRQFLERVERYNREALVYNLTLPKGIPRRQTLRGKLLIEQALRRESPN